MVSDVELQIIDADERRDTPVVVRYVPQLGQWFICHERSYQNAFARDINGFDSRNDAVDFAEDHDCDVRWHDFDVLQTY